MDTMYSRFIFVENTISNLPKVPRVKSLGSDGLFCFISICKFGIFKNPFATITSLCEFFLRRLILLVQTKKSDFCELWQQHKQLKTMELSEAWPDIYSLGYMHQFQPEPTHKILWQQQKHWILKISSYRTYLKWLWRPSQ